MEEMQPGHKSWIVMSVHSAFGDFGERWGISELLAAGNLKIKVHRPE